MSLSKNVSQSRESRQPVPVKGTSLNPNAAEFVPFSLRASTANTNANTSSPDSVPNISASPFFGKQVLDRSEPSVSNHSDEEAHQYWQHQLPDDITPDFKVMGEEDSAGHGSLSLSALSLHDDSEANRFSDAGYVTNEQMQLLSHTNGTAFSDKTRFPISSYGDDTSQASFLHHPPKQWEKQLAHSDHHAGNSRDGPLFDKNAICGYPNDMFNETSLLENSDMNPMDFLALQFPGFAAESLAEVYFANSCDLHSTIEMLTQLELQVDGAFDQNMEAKTLSAPNLTSLDFPSLPVAHNKANLPKYAVDEIQQGGNPYRASEKENLLLFKSGPSLPSRGAIDFASAVRKLASQDSSMWKYNRNGSADASVGSSRSSRVLASSYNNGPTRCAYSDRFQSRSARAAPTWLETGDAVANMYSEFREEARDHARIRNAYFEQARQAYLIGNKALAKDLSMKGQLHNMQMKSAHTKAQESIYRQRNPVSPDMQASGRGQERMIDLHGLHVSEAIHVLKHELAVLRSAARSAEQRFQVYICVGTGHHTKGSRTPRLPTAVQQYLLEEGLDYAEPQPGLLRVLLH